MFEMSVPWWELIVRALIVYCFLLLLIRLSGKKHVGELAPFDLLLLLILSESVQNAMNPGDESVTGGLVIAATLIGINHFVGYLSFRSKKIERIVEGTPKVLVYNGKVDQKIMNQEQVTQHELETAMRHEGVSSLKKVKFAVLESDGAISIIKKSG
jgi:uncharacterized membrane protein YcaP (DUF421 family)